MKNKVKPITERLRGQTGVNGVLSVFFRWSYFHLDYQRLIHKTCSYFTALVARRYEYAYRVSIGFDPLQKLDLVQTLVEEVLVVLDHLEANRVPTSFAQQVAALQRRAEGGLSDVSAHLIFCLYVLVPPWYATECANNSST